jgi:hypothetical protein
MGWAWWCTPVIPALRGLRREDREFKVNLGYRGRPHLNSKVAMQPGEGLLR